MSHKKCTASVEGYVDSYNILSCMYQGLDRNRIYKGPYRKKILEALPEGFRTSCNLITLKVFEPLAVSSNVSSIGKIYIYNMFPWMDDWFLKMYNLAGRPRLDYHLTFGHAREPTFYIFNRIHFCSMKEVKSLKRLYKPFDGVANTKELIRASDLLALIKGRIVC